MADLTTQFAEFEKRMIDRFARLEKQGEILFRGLKLFAQKEAAMSKLTDELSSLADTMATDIDTLIGFKEDDSAALGSLKAKFTTAGDKLKKAIEDHKAAQAAADDLAAPAAAAPIPAAPVPATPFVPGAIPPAPTDITGTAPAGSSPAPVGKTILADGTTA